MENTAIKHHYDASPRVMKVAENTQNNPAIKPAPTPAAPGMTDAPFFTSISHKVNEYTNNTIKYISNIDPAYGVSFGLVAVAAALFIWRTFSI